MQHQKRKRIIQKLWGWICLAINCVIMTVYLAEQRAELLGGGILFAVLIICYGAVKTQMDKTKEDMSITSVVIEYGCVYMITFLAGFKVGYDLPSVSVLVALVIASVAELLVLFCINYWNAIHRFIEKKKNRT